MAGGTTARRAFRDIQVFLLSQGLIPYGITIRRWTKRSLTNIVFKLCWVVPSWLVTSNNVCAGPKSFFSCVFTNAEFRRGLPHYLSKMPSDTLRRMVAKVEVAHFIVPAKKSTRPNFEEVYSGAPLCGQPVNTMISLLRPLYSDPGERKFSQSYSYFKNSTASWYGQNFVSRW